METAGYLIYGVSYDPVDTLASFSRRHAIGFRLLSDVGSVEMARLGVIDRDIERHQARFGIPVADRHRGLPYPGTFVLNEDGVVVSKHFAESYRERASGGYFLDQVGGVSSRRPYLAESAEPPVTVRAWVDEAVYRPLQWALIHLEISLEDGFHAYVDPVPAGFAALEVELAPSPGLEVRAATVPSGTPFSVAGLDEEFSVIEGTTTLTIPFKVSGTQHELDGQKRSQPIEDDDVTLDVRIRLQVCSTADCFPPIERRLPIPLVEAPLVQ